MRNIFIRIVTYTSRDEQRKEPREKKRRRRRRNGEHKVLIVLIEHIECYAIMASIPDGIRSSGLYRQLPTLDFRNQENPPSAHRGFCAV